MKNTGWPSFNTQITAFTSEKINRFDYIANLLKEAKVGHEVLRVEGSRHFLIRSPKRNHPSRNIKTFVAHYDRHSTSPGANDNSSAVLNLIGIVKELKTGLPANNQLLLTDREEVDRQTGLKAQGAWHLADWLIKQQISDWSFFHFDAFGRGETVVLSTTSNSLLQKSKQTSRSTIRKNLLQHNLLKQKLQAEISEQVVPLPTPLSDDISFAMQGFSSSLLTCLPHSEAKDYARFQTTPETWKLINSPRDEISTLTDKTQNILRSVVRTLIKWDLPREVGLA